MKMTLALILSLLTGFGSLAYASARLECASRMAQPVAPAASIGTRDGMAKNHACCPKRACQCSIKAPSNNSSVPAQIAPERVDQVLVTSVFDTQHSFQEQTPLPNLFLKAPPGSPPALFSVLRV